MIILYDVYSHISVDGYMAKIKEVQQLQTNNQNKQSAIKSQAIQLERIERRVPLAQERALCKKLFSLRSTISSHVKRPREC